MEANLNLDDWKGKDAKPSREVLKKPMIIVAKRDFSKPAKTKDGKQYTAVYHILYAILDENGEKIKVFASDNLNKRIDPSKLPIHAHIEFVPNAGKYGKGFYKLVVKGDKSKTDTSNAETQKTTISTTSNVKTTQTQTPKKQ